MQQVEPLQGKPTKEQNFSEPEFVQNKVSGWDFNQRFSQSN